MGTLNKLEQRIEAMVNGAFAKAFKSPVQPLEFAGALRRECDINARIGDRDHTVAPNGYVVELSPDDHEWHSQCSAVVTEELVDKVREHATQQRYSFMGPLKVQLQLADDLDTGQYRVRSRIETPPEVQQALRTAEHYRDTYPPQAWDGGWRTRARQPPAPVLRGAKQLLTSCRFTSLGLAIGDNGMLIAIGGQGTASGARGALRGLLSPGWTAPTLPRRPGTPTERPLCGVCAPGLRRAARRKVQRITCAPVRAMRKTALSSTTGAEGASAPNRRRRLLPSTSPTSRSPRGTTGTTPAPSLMGPPTSSKDYRP
ncbi:DUF3662 domain-containing protein [Kitasatospora sp. NPDC057223]|uniref:DUF3662 domain-containing protein n=1 Tax=Kitasatospora sp. NPDC057223 TaxID=3346055 RepID=UPI0036453E4C